VIRFRPGARALLAAFLLLAGCAAAPPVPPEFEPPRAVGLAPLRAERPIVALALGGGGARGFAHVGVIEELERNGIVPDIVVGSSAGSFVGALYAGGIGGAALEEIALGMEEADVRDLVISRLGFVRGERMQAFINRRLQDRRIEELPRRFAAVATDLASGARVAFTRGDTGMAVRASSSFPVLFQPVEIEGRRYMDGGLTSPVPVEVARALGADVVIGVDVGRRPEYAGALDSLPEIILQALAIMGKYVGQAERQSADVLIVPDVSDVGLVDFPHRKAAIDAGAAAGRGAIEAIRKAIAARKP